MTDYKKIMDIRVDVGGSAPLAQKKAKKDSSPVSVNDNEVLVIISSSSPNANIRGPLLPRLVGPASAPSQITSIPSRSTFDGENKISTGVGSGDPSHEERLRHHHRYLHPCYSKGLDDDKKVRLWTIVNLLLSLLDFAFCIYHLLIASGTVKLTAKYSVFYNLFHGVECDIIAKTGLALHCTLVMIYVFGSILLLLAVCAFQDIDIRVHLSNWYMHLCGIPLVGILTRIPVGIVSQHSCSMPASAGTVATYWGMNTILFFLTGFWVFYMHSVAHLFIHWLKTPVPVPPEGAYTRTLALSQSKGSIPKVIVMDPTMTSPAKTN